jgi:hypothetical protein
MDIKISDNFEPIFFTDKNMGKMQLLNWSNELWLARESHGEWITVRKATEKDLNILKNTVGGFVIL